MTPRPVAPASRPAPHHEGRVLRRSASRACRAVVAGVCCAAAITTPAWAITGAVSTTQFRSVSDGVQFAPSWVLSAHHVGYAVNGLYSNGYGSALIDAVYSPAGAGFPADDLMLIRLATPISAAPSLQLSSTVFSATAFDVLNPSMDVSVTLTSNSNASPGPRAYAFGQLREFVSSYPDDHDNNPATPSIMRSVNWLVTYPNNMGAPYVESGDSGGGLFFGHVTDDTSPLLGIGSALLTDINAPGQLASAYVSVASYRSWIDSTMQNDGADLQMAQWVSTPVPEPAAWALWLAGAAALGAWQRGKVPKVRL